jgi:hypothetical protein
VAVIFHNPTNAETFGDREPGQMKGCLARRHAASSQPDIDIHNHLALRSPVSLGLPKIPDMADVVNSHDDGGVLRQLGKPAFASVAISFAMRILSTP